MQRDSCAIPATSVVSSARTEKKPLWVMRFVISSTIISPQVAKISFEFLDWCRWHFTCKTLGVPSGLRLLSRFGNVVWRVSSHCLPQDRHPAMLMFPCQNDPWEEYLGDHKRWQFSHSGWVWHDFGEPELFYQKLGFRKYISSCFRRPIWNAKLAWLPPSEICAPHVQ